MEANCPKCKRELKIRNDVSKTESVLTEYCSCGFSRPKEGATVSEIWAYLVIDPKDKNEGIAGFQTPTGMMPMIAADRGRVEHLREYAEDISRNLGVDIRLVRFSAREIVDTIHGKH